MDGHKVVGGEEDKEEESSHPLQSEPPTTFLSPTGKPPPQVQSYNSLLDGEDYANSGAGTADNYIIGSYSDDDQETTPPSIHSGLPQSSPPPLIQAPPDIFVNTSVSYPSQATKKGRPPRRPVAFTPSTKVQTTQTEHTRGQSTGEFSFISALTDPLGDDAKLQRGVSWDEGNIFNISVDDDQQARLQEPFFTPLPPIINGEPPRSIHRSPGAQSANRVEDKLAMTDIVGPIESEAETAIMKALEDRERNMVRPTAATILPNLTDEAITGFQEYDIEQQQQGEASMSSPRPSPESIRSVNSQKSTGNSNTQQNKAALDKAKHHRRTYTTATNGENTLYSLATIMRNIHKNEDHGANETEQRHVLAPRDIGHPAAVTSVEKPKTQSDALANNAALLLRRKRKDPEDTVVNASNEETDPLKNDDIILEDENESYSNEEQDIELGEAVSGNGGSGSQGSKRVRPSLEERLCCKAMNDAKGVWETFCTFLGDHKKGTVAYAKYIFLWLILPATSVAAVLYYGLANPSMSAGYDPDTQHHPSISWFILFLCVRQVITFSLAKVTEIFLIDFLALKTRFLLRLLGPLLTLLVVLSKGWPCTFVFWTVCDLAMLSGTGEFANHWVYYQNVVELFNANNPSGSITCSVWNYRILVSVMIIGILVAVKRLIVGLYLGGRQYSTYGSKLAVVIRKMIVVSQVASLGREIERKGSAGLTMSKRASREDIFNWNVRGFGDAALEEEDEAIDDEILHQLMSMNERVRPESEATKASALGADAREECTHDVKTPERIKIAQLMDKWEEPPEEQYIGNRSIQGILQFKQTLAFMDLSYPFTTAFGLADNRENCVQSAKEIYKCLLLGNPHSDTLQFETLSTLARSIDSEQLDETKLKELVKVFRPERNGTLDLLGFLRSVDRVYKELRLLRASIRNSSQIDHAFETLINIGFYAVVFFIVLFAWGINPLTLFLSLSSFVLALTFAIGRTSASYFEGLMFILARHPYDIGDRISINKADEPPSLNGVLTWYVEEVTLYYTTVRLGVTNEVATIANSSLASCRIVNAARSQNAIIYIKLKFGVNAPYAKIQLFKEAVISFIKVRPRTWVKCCAIRTSRVEADLGFVEYTLVLMHRDSWQHISPILGNKGEVMSFCLEVQKQLGMRYIAPPTPVDLTMKNPQLLSSLMQGTAGINPASSDHAGPQQESGNELVDLSRIVDMFPLPLN